MQERDAASVHRDEPCPLDGTELCQEVCPLLHTDARGHGSGNAPLGHLIRHGNVLTDVQDITLATKQVAYDLKR